MKKEYILKEKTIEENYTKRLQKSTNSTWKKALDAQFQRPYRWNLNRLNLGKTLDVGCGIGRNLINLSNDSVGVDHNPHSIKIAKEKGLNALTTDEFNKSKYNEKDVFDSLLLAHVIEHMRFDDAIMIIEKYLPCVKNMIVIICPQEKGFKSDKTHVNFFNKSDIENILNSFGLKVVKSYSFPLRKQAGKIFIYNENIVVARKI